MTAVVAGQGTGRVGVAARRRVAELEAENVVLRAEADQWHAEADRLRRDNERLQARIEGLRAQVEALRRAAKRQAAPFSREALTRNPKRPGRKPGAAYGTRAHRRPPERVDRVVAVPLPPACPACGGRLVTDRVAASFQEDLPLVQPEATRFDLEIGHCADCGRRVQPRHPEQISDALGAAAAGLGPRAIALVAWLNKELGLPVAKVARVLEQFGGLRVTPGGLHQALARVAEVAAPTYQALVERMRASRVVAPDETGWRVAGQRAWLWAFVGEGVTVYRIAPGRGYEQAKEVLGADFDGVVERDGWAPYRKFLHATHQSCLAHLLRRCRELVSDADRGQAKTPHAVRRILQRALAVREAGDAGQLDAGGVAAEAGRLGAAVDKLIAGRTTYPPNRKLLAHLATERAALFTFLAEEGVQPTNWRAEQAIRPAVVCRKHWGGNRTWAGATTWQVLTSILRTCRQQGVDPIGVLVALQRQAIPGMPAELVLPGHAPTAARPP
jgi:transposase